MATVSGWLLTYARSVLKPRPEAWLLSLRDKIQIALSSAIPEHDDPWVLQLYVQDETRLDRLAGDIAAYAKPEAKESVFSKSWFATLEAHLAEISRPGRPICR